MPGERRLNSLLAVRRDISSTSREDGAVLCRSQRTELAVLSLLALETGRGLGYWEILIQLLIKVRKQVRRRVHRSQDVDAGLDS